MKGMGQKSANLQTDALACSTTLQHAVAGRTVRGARVGGDGQAACRGVASVGRARAPERVELHAASHMKHEQGLTKQMTDQPRSNGWRHTSNPGGHWPAKSTLHILGTQHVAWLQLSASKHMAELRTLNPAFRHAACGHSIAGLMVQHPPTEHRVPHAVAPGCGCKVAPSA
jgi:hypothetical protein